METHQRTQILIQCLSPCFCIYSASTLHYCTKQARYNPQRGVNLQAPAFYLQTEKTVHPSQSLPKSVRLLKMPFLAPMCTPLSNSEHCVRVVTLLRTELIVTEYWKTAGEGIRRMELPAAQPNDSCGLQRRPGCTELRGGRLYSAVCL